MLKSTGRADRGWLQVQYFRSVVQPSPFFSRSMRLLQQLHIERFSFCINKEFVV